MPGNGQPSTTSEGPRILSSELGDLYPGFYLSSEKGGKASITRYVKSGTCPKKPGSEQVDFSKAVFGGREIFSDCLTDLIDIVVNDVWSHGVYHECGEYSKTVEKADGSKVSETKRFSHGQRHTKNFSYADVIGLDVDDGMSLDEASKVFAEQKLHGFIALSKSHGVEKQGKPACDRFRIVVIPNKRITNKDVFDATFSALASLFGNATDDNSKDCARFYNPASKGLYKVFWGEPFPVISEEEAVKLVPSKNTDPRTLSMVKAWEKRGPNQSYIPHAGIGDWDILAEMAGVDFDIQTREDLPEAITKLEVELYGDIPPPTLPLPEWVAPYIRAHWAPGERYGVLLRVAPWFYACVVSAEDATNIIEDLVGDFGEGCAWEEVCTPLEKMYESLTLNIKARATLLNEIVAVKRLKDRGSLKASTSQTKKDTRGFFYGQPHPSENVKEYTEQEAVKIIMENKVQVALTQEEEHFFYYDIDGAVQAGVFSLESDFPVYTFHEKSRRYDVPGCAKNIQYALGKLGFRNLCFNELSGRNYLDASTDLDEERLVSALQVLFSYLNPNAKSYVRKLDIQTTVDVICSRKSFHPTKIYFESIEWDGVCRYDEVFNTVILDEDYVSEDNKIKYKEWFYKWCLGVVKKVYNHEFYNITPVLTGATGKGKSAWIKALFPVKSAFTESTPDIGNKDTNVTRSIKNVWFLDEVSKLMFYHEDKLKDFLTGTTSTDRTAYARKHTDIKFQCSFIGATNQKRFLCDSTGNRRFLIMEIADVRYEYMEDGTIDVQQFWAEMYYRVMVLKENAKFSSEESEEVSNLMTAKNASVRNVIYAETLKDMNFVAGEVPVSLDRLAVFLHRTVSGSGGGTGTLPRGVKSDIIKVMSGLGIKRRSVKVGGRSSPEDGFMLDRGIDRLMG